jgi:hypothetical protein
MAGFRIEGDTSGNVVEVNALKHIKVIGETDTSTNPNNVGAVKYFAENDNGSLTGSVLLRSPEVDVDYRTRVSQDIILDDEVFNYSTQNTGKHQYQSGSLIFSWAPGQLTTNAGNIVTAGTGAHLATYACFPMLGTSTLSGDFELGFSAQPQTNVVVEFGMGLLGTTSNAPLDGVFFRLTSAGLMGVASSNGIETVVGPFLNAPGGTNWTYANSQRYQFICYASTVEAQFWVNDGTGTVSLGKIPQPAAQSRMFMSSGVQAFVKHRIVGGAAGGALNCLVGAYNVRLGGTAATTTPSTSGSRVFGSYQGVSGGVMGGLSSYANSSTPAAAIPSNTALTANLPNGLGGQGSVASAAAAATDGIWGSYQIPVNTVNVQGRRLVLRGVKVDAVVNGASIAGSATTIQFSLAYGHTTVSLGTAEGISTKAPRRMALGYMTWPVGAGIGAQPQTGPLFMDLGDAPIFVNPGEFIQLVGKFLVGTVTASQTLNFIWTPIYSWE